MSSLDPGNKNGLVQAKPAIPNAILERDRSVIFSFMCTDRYPSSLLRLCTESA